MLRLQQKARSSGWLIGLVRLVEQEVRCQFFVLIAREVRLNDLIPLES